MFKVHNRDGFVKQVLPVYFRQTRYKSFVRQLNLWGFTCVSRGSNKGSYFNDRFIESDPNLCFGMRRVKIKGAAVAATKTNRSKFSPQRLTRSHVLSTTSDSGCTTCTSPSEAPVASRMFPRERSEESSIPETVKEISNPIPFVQYNVANHQENSDKRYHVAVSEHSPAPSTRPFEFPAAGPYTEENELNMVSIKDCFFSFGEDDMNLDLSIFD